MERLRGLDTAFLYLETPTSHLHVAWAAFLDTREAPDAASCRRLCELIGDRLHLLPALRQRLADRRLGYTQPDWIDAEVDPADHCTVPRSADLEAVAAEASRRRGSSDGQYRTVLRRRSVLRLARAWCA